MSVANLPQAIADHPRIGQWLSFDTPERIRLRSGRVELGQGVATALVQIAAEELDVDPERIDLIAGDTRESPNEGHTAGSRSIEVGGMSVRFAAAAARQVLLAHAAQLLQARIADLTVVDGSILANGASTDLTYWSLAREVDLGQNVADHADPKPAAQHTLVGHSLPRRDLPLKVTRGGAFIHDLVLPGMLHGRVLHPPSYLSRIVGVDDAEIARMPGVIAVVRDGSFLGVTAIDEVTALAAVKQLETRTTWSSPAEAPPDPVQALKQSTADAAVSYLAGNPEKVNGRRVSTLVSRPYLVHASIGTACALAQWENGRLLVHSHTQGAFQLRDALAAVLDMPRNAITVVHVPGAGCYGHNGADDVALEAALLARATPGRPVRLVWSRADELSAGPLGSAMAIRAEAVVDSNDRIQAFTIDVTSQAHGQRPSGGAPANLQAGTYISKPLTPGRAEDPSFAGGGGADRNALPSYAIPHVRVVKRIVQDLPYRTSSLRGLGAQMNVFAVETLMDDVAYEIGADPLALRLSHLDDERAQDVLRRAAALAGWPGEIGEGSGLGLAFARYKLKAAYCAVAVRVQIDEDVRLTHAWSAVDAGEVITPDGMVNQIEGGIVQAASWTLKEAVRFENDAVSTRSWETYPILRFSEVPEIAVEIVGRPDQPPLGVGEASIGPTAAAIGNAIRRALGVRVRDLPLTRDAIAAAIG